MVISLCAVVAAGVTFLNRRSAIRQPA
jgi:hypothetical protein